MSPSKKQKLDFRGVSALESESAESSETVTLIQSPMRFGGGQDLTKTNTSGLSVWTMMY